MEYFGSWFIWFPLTISLLYLLTVAKERFSNGGRLPPGPTPLPIVGNLFQLGDMPHRSLAHLAKKYGPVMSLKFGQLTTIVLSSPGAVRDAFQVQDQFLSGRYLPDVARALDTHETMMVWLPPTEKWRHLRTIVRTYLFNTQRLDANQGVRQQKIQELIDHVRGRIGQTVDIGNAAFCTALNQISNTLFSVNLVSLDFESGQEFKDLVHEILDDIGSPNLVDFFPLFGILINPQRRRRRITDHISKLYKIFDDIIDKRLQAVAQEEKLPNSGHDVLDSLLQLHLQDKSKLDRHTIKGMLQELFIGGTDTSSTVIEWAIAELFRNPHVMEKLHAELMTVIGPGKQLEESDISRLPYLRAVVKESFRLHSPGPLLIPRMAEKSVEVGGYIVPKNSKVMVNMWAIGRDENVWEDPELFMPERFLTSEVDLRGHHFELIPFGTGRRMCPGMNLGYLMVHMTIGSLAHSFKWKLPDGMKPSDVDFKAKFGLNLALAVPVPAIPLPVNS